MSQLDDTHDLLNMGDAGSGSKESDSALRRGGDVSGGKAAPVNGAVAASESDNASSSSAALRNSSASFREGPPGRPPLLSQRFTVARQHLPGQLHEILMWRNKYRSGLAFALGNLFFYFTTFGELSIITVFSMIVFWIVLLGSCLVLLSRALAYLTSASPVPGASPVGTTAPTRRLLNRETAERLTESTMKTVNGLGNLLRDAAHCRDWQLTVKVLLGSYLIGKLGPLFLNMYMGWLIFLSVMTLPKVYEWKQRDIDDLIREIQPVLQSKLYEAEALIKNHISSVLSQIPPKVHEYSEMLRAQLRALTGASDRARSSSSRPPFSAGTSAATSSSMTTSAETKED
jgi:hypothetical protein